MVILYPSALLFHGPGAREEALNHLDKVGRQISQPVGENGLKVDDARYIIEMMNSAPVGDDPGVILIGPMDKANSSASDVLLKVVEEFEPEAVRPVLWATDLGGVSSTIKSRCIHRWCPSGAETDEFLVTLAFDLIEASVERRYAAVLEVLNDYREKPAQDLLAATAHALATQGELTGGRFRLWTRVRKLLSYRLGDQSITKLKHEVASCYCGV